MTTIFTFETEEVHTISLTTSSGVDYLADVIGNSGVPMGERADFDLSLDDYRWWKRWATNEQTINDAIEERNLAYEIPNFYDQYHDWEDAQAAYARYLGIELQ
jgi:hypothetical protein